MTLTKTTQKFMGKVSLITAKPFIIILSLFFVACQNPAQEEPITLFAESGLVMSATTGDILFEKNMDNPLFPASTTKLMAILLVMKELDKGTITTQTRVIISENAAGVPASRAGFFAGDTVSVYHLIMAAMLPSGSEATMALGEHIFGTEEDFVAAMNEKARHLNMDNTHFTNSVGLDHHDHQTTAYDMALLAKYFIHYYSDIFHFSSHISYVYNGGGGNTILMRNTNDMLHIPGVNGLKTGSSPRAGSGLVFTYETGADTLIFVVMGAPDGALRRFDSQLLLERFTGEG